MATESSALPRLKEFKYRVEFNGLTVSLVQDFDPGDRTIGVTEHAGAGQNFPSKEAGMMKFENVVLKMVVPATGADRTFWSDWMDKCQDPTTGDGDVPANYRKNFSFYELAPDGSVARTWEYYNAFPMQIKPGNRHSMGDNKDVLEEVHVAYEYRTVKG